MYEFLVYHRERVSCVVFVSDCASLEKKSELWKVGDVFVASVLAIRYHNVGELHFGVVLKILWSGNYYTSIKSFQ